MITIKRCRPKVETVEALIGRDHVYVTSGDGSTFVMSKEAFWANYEEVVGEQLGLPL